ncbi:MAG: YihY/virulence factor BrkB family protein [Bacteriovoracia bacterium]
MRSKREDQDRGRNAESPRHIPYQGWKDVMKRVKSEVKSDRLSLVSAAMAYYALFAFVPSLTAIVLMYAWISDPSEIQQHMSAVSEFLPKEAQTIISDQLGQLSGQASGALRLGVIGALLIALWSASKGSKAIIEAMNIIYDEKEERGFFKLNFFALGMTLLAALLGILAIGVLVVVPAVMSFLDFVPFMGFIIQTVSWILLLAIFSFFLSFAYRFGPNRSNAKWKWVSSGAVISSVLWAIVSALFSWYAQEFGNFNKTYGSLGAIIVLMMWFYLSSFVILLGGEINAELEHQTKKDSTEEPDQPMGERNAYVADTLGESPIHH